MTRLFEHANNNSLSYWKREWQRRHAASCLKQSQRMTPERWELFYDQVSDIWDAMTGSSGRIAREISAFVMDHNLCAEGDSVLDIGTGSGALALALASKGCRVTALDQSAGMIGTLQHKIHQWRITGIQTVNQDWRHFAPDSRFDLVAACFFPDALCPSGLRGMESFAAGRCLLALGSGADVFPLRRALWVRIMDVPLPESGDHLECAFQYLSAMGRKPKTAALSVPVSLNADVGRIEAFYRSYFAIFDRTDPRSNRCIADIIGAYATQGRVTINGVVNLQILNWKV